MTEEVDRKIQERKDVISRWFKNQHNLILVAVILLGAIIRLYYFSLTKDQALWWDALSYGSIAKTFFLSGDWAGSSAIVAGEILIRPPLFPFLWGLLMKIGFSELLSKFALQFIPSVLSIFFVYLIGKKMYGHKEGLIAAFILAMSWIHIFYSMRMLTGMPSLFLAAISIYYFFKSQDASNQKYFALSIFFLSLSLMMRYPMGLLGLTYLILLFTTSGLSFLKKSTFWKGGLIGILPIILLFIVNMLFVGSFFPALDQYYGEGNSGLSKFGFGYNAWGFLSHILQTPLYYAFLLGLIATVISLVIGFD
ncbi:MAG: glycosyltransferase family 39 protein, partial [Nanoarchaeota archaeon]